MTTVPVIDQRSEGEDVVAIMSDGEGWEDVDGGGFDVESDVRDRPSQSSSPIPVASPILGEEEPPSLSHSVEAEQVLGTDIPPLSDVPSSMDCGVRHSDYSDRTRLLYHVTHLATQWQRAQLQLQEQHRALVILQQQHYAMLMDQRAGSLSSSTVREGSEPRDGWVSVAVMASGLTAAVIAAKDEAELQLAIEERQHLFDPLLAQNQIHRLDDALGHLSLLREAEMRRAKDAEDELQKLRAAHLALVSHAEAISADNEQLHSQCTAQERQLAQYALEVERQRMEELRLNHQVACLQRFAEGSPIHQKGVEVVPSAPVVPATSSPDPVWVKQAEKLMMEEQQQRQVLWISMFWEPMAMALDAGITWLVEREEFERLSVVPPGEGRVPFPDAANGGVEGAESADYFLLRHQQAELQEARLTLDVAQQRLRASEQEVERCKALYTSEKRRAERREEDHKHQLRQAYEEIVKERELIKVALQRDVEVQVRTAFSDGRMYEKEVQSKSKGAK